MGEGAGGRGGDAAVGGTGSTLCSPGARASGEGRPPRPAPARPGCAPPPWETLLGGVLLPSSDLGTRRRLGGGAGATACAGEFVPLTHRPTAPPPTAGISRNGIYKRRATGAKQSKWHKKRKYELGRVPANTKLGHKDVRPVRVRGGNQKQRALRLDAGNFSWPTEAQTRKARILDVCYNASNNELVRTQTLVKNAVVQIDAAPFRHWFESHYGLRIGVKKERGKKVETHVVPEGKQSAHVQRKIAERAKGKKVDTALDDQISKGRLYACITSRPGQCGRADGYILEGEELNFYLKKMQKKR